MRFDPKTITLASYRPPVFEVSCPRCTRGAQIDRAQMLRRFGDITLHEVAQRIAGAGGCALAVDDHPICSSTAFETDVKWWGTLDDAFRGKWIGRLTCHRHLAALKRTEPCPGWLELDVKTLVSVLGGDFKLERLQSRCCCWLCNTKHVAIDWIVPDEPTPSGGTAEQTATVLRLRPSRIQLAQDRFRAIEGGKRR